MSLNSEIYFKLPIHLFNWRGYTHAMVHIWRSDSNPKESIFSCHHVAPHLPAQQQMPLSTELCSEPNLELLILRPLPPEHWGYRCVPLCLANVVMGIYPRDLSDKVLYQLSHTPRPWSASSTTKTSLLYRKSSYFQKGGRLCPQVSHPQVFQRQDTCVPHRTIADSEEL